MAVARLFQPGQRLVCSIFRCSDVGPSDVSCLHHRSVAQQHSLALPIWPNKPGLELAFGKINKERLLLLNALGRGKHMETTSRKREVDFDPLNTEAEIAVRLHVDMILESDRIVADHEGMGLRGLRQKPDLVQKVRAEVSRRLQDHSYCVDLDFVLGLRPNERFSLGPWCDVVANGLNLLTQQAAHVFPLHPERSRLNELDSKECGQKSAALGWNCADRIILKNPLHDGFCLRLDP